MQFGNVRRELAVEQLVRGFCIDINKLEVARFDKNLEAIKEIEANLSHGLQMLSEVFSDQLTVVRECILTSFSLTPSEKLFKQLVKLAQDSGFVEAKMEAEAANPIENRSSIDWNADFTAVCDDFVDSLNKKGFGKAATKVRADTVLQEKKERNLEALTSLQGDLLTKAKNYDPVRRPLKTMTSKVLGLNEKLVCDLQCVILDPRWQVIVISKLCLYLMV